MTRVKYKELRLKQAREWKAVSESDDVLFKDATTAPRDSLHHYCYRITGIKKPWVKHPIKLYIMCVCLCVCGRGNFIASTGSTADNNT